MGLYGGSYTQSLCSFEALEGHSDLVINRDSFPEIDLSLVTWPKDDLSSHHDSSFSHIFCIAT